MIDWTAILALFLGAEIGAFVAFMLFAVFNAGKRADEDAARWENENGV